MSQGHVEIAKALVDAGGEALLLKTDSVHGSLCTSPSLLLCALRGAPGALLLINIMYHEYFILIFNPKFSSHLQSIDLNYFGLFDQNSA